MNQTRQLGLFEATNSPPIVDKIAGSHTLLHGDCLELMTSVPDSTVHLIVTDPPYFIDWMKWDAAASFVKKGKAKVIEGLPVGMNFDPREGQQLQEFFEQVSIQAMRTLCPGAFFLVFSLPRLSHRMMIAMENQGFEIRDVYAWHHRKGRQKAFSQDHFVRKMRITEQEKSSIIHKLDGRKTPQLRPQFDSIIVGQKPKDGTYVNNWMKWETGLIDLKATKLNGHTPTTLMHAERPAKDQCNGHLTVKPVQIIETLIRLFSKKGQLVLDPFVGSGTTLLAARNTGRDCIGMEINKEYVKIANLRMAKDSGGLQCD